MSKLHLVCSVGGEERETPKEERDRKGPEDQKNQPSSRSPPGPLREGADPTSRRGTRGQLCLLRSFSVPLGFSCSEHIVGRKENREAILRQRRSEDGRAAGPPPPPRRGRRPLAVGRGGETQPERQLRARISGPADSPILCFQPQIPRLLTSQHLC